MCKFPRGGGGGGGSPYNVVSYLLPTVLVMMFLMHIPYVVYMYLCLHKPHTVCRSETGVLVVMTWAYWA